MTYTVIYRMLPIAEASVRAYCFYRLVKPFLCSPGMLQKRGRVRLVGVAYALIMILLPIMPFVGDAYTAYGLGSLMMFLVLCLTDKRNYKQKAFLVMVFFSLNWLSSAMAEIIYDNLYAFAERTDYMRSHLDMWVALYIGVSAVYLLLEFLFTAVAIWQVLRAYKNKRTDMRGRELIMLSLPSLMGVMAYQIIQHHRMFYIVEGGENKTGYDFLMVLFYAASVIAIVVVIVLYQDIRAKEEENRQTEFLAMQMDSIRRHIGHVESLYQNIRSARHDMTNHIVTLERLYEENKTKEAVAYGTDLKAALLEVTGEIQSGNPVTDVILQERKKEAEQKNVRFEIAFYYPNGAAINAFDVSVILHNALQNAIEYAAECEVPFISIRSYHRKNAYMIEVCNSFCGTLEWDAQSGLPITSKPGDGHGYGLSNIRRVAHKYNGELAVDLKDGVFCLSVMLMMASVDEKF